jgi:thioredoxin reductase (NADPH)
MEGSVQELVILGSGPAGLTAAIYAGRASLAPVVITGLRSGGRLTMPPMVENFPGFPDGIDGPTLMQRTIEQAKRFGASLVSANAKSVNVRNRPFTVHTEEESFLCKALIIATGADPQFLGLPKEKELIGRGISTCATCDGFFFRDRNVFVIGGGDTAMEDSLFLSRFAKKITVVHRRDQLRASKILQEQAFANPRVDFMWDTVVEEFVGEDVLEGVRVRNLKTGEVSEHACEGVFLAIGHIPNTQVLRGQIQLDDEGYIVTRGRTRTSVEGVFAAGDVVDKVYRQAVTAAGSGCMAALDGERWLAANP